MSASDQTSKSRRAIIKGQIQQTQRNERANTNFDNQYQRKTSNPYAVKRTSNLSLNGRLRQPGPKRPLVPMTRTPDVPYRTKPTKS